jgi:hypothetical protein
VQDRLGFNFTVTTMATRVTLSLVSHYENKWQRRALVVYEVDDLLILIVADLARETQTILLRNIFLSQLHFLASSMTEDGYTSSSALDSGDQSESQLNVPFHGRPSFQSLDSVEETESTNGHITSISPQPRSSSDSRSKSPISQPWRDTAPSLSDRREQLPSLVEPSFDEHVLRALCELDVIFFPLFDILHNFSDFFNFISAGFLYFLIELNKARYLVEYAPPSNEFFLLFPDI